MTETAGPVQEVIHLTLTGPNAGLPACVLVTMDEVPAWGTGGYVHPEGHRGAHYAHAPAALTSGEDPRACQACVRAFADAS